MLISAERFRPEIVLRLVQGQASESPVQSDESDAESRLNFVGDAASIVHRQRVSGLRYNCAGMARRDFLQLGFGAVMGLGFSDLLRSRAAAAEAAGKPSPEQVNCILIWLDGGPTHYESFDPKPDAPKEIRGEFKPISTSVPGIQFCEIVPQLAKTAHKFTVIRS